MRPRKRLPFARNNARVIVFGVVFITLAGLYAITALPSGIYPEIEFPRIVAVAQSGDLSPRLMMIAVTRPLEEAARQVLGVRRVRSRTIRGATELSLVFNPDGDMPYALQLMQGKVDEVKSDLPAGTQVRVERMTPSFFPMMEFNVTGDMPITFTLSPMRNFLLIAINSYSFLRWIAACWRSIRASRPASSE